MKASTVLGRTSKEAVNASDATSHQMLVRAGFIRQLGQGLFTYLPLGLRVLRRIETILREEMDAIDGAELSMPVMHPAELWRKTGRWSEIGPELFRLNDRRERELALAMTHEEVAASLAVTEIYSWRDLPKFVYQIQLKFRDDPRPRAGLVRAREFTMKDAYSFDRDQEGLDRRYQMAFDQYFKIFERCQLPVLAVASDVGAMGGSEAHEFMYLSPLGEDSLVLCSECGYAKNRQVATSRKATTASASALALELVDTPDVTTVEEVCAFLGVSPLHIAKSLFLVWTDFSGIDHPVVAVVRGDCTLNETKLTNLLGGGDLRPMTTEEMLSIGSVPGFASPVGLGDEATVVLDELVRVSSNFVTGANKPQQHFRNVFFERDVRSFRSGDIVAADHGDICINCGSSLHLERGIEVGNIFKLGTKYSRALEATYVDVDGQEQFVVMGSYGIGVGRIMACIAEAHNDSTGLMWPKSVAPFDVHLCSLESDDQVETQALYHALSEQGVQVFWDDRGERAGVQFADADLLGIPLRLLVSRKTIENDEVEVRRRDTGEVFSVARSAIAEWLKTNWL